MSSASTFDQRAFFRKYRVLIVTVFCGLLLLSAYLILKRVPPGPEQLFETYFVVYALPADEETRDGSPVAQAMYAAYQAGEYRLAISTFNQLAQPRPLDHLVYGVSYLAAGRPVGGLASLNLLAEWQDAYAAEALWYLALAYVKMDDLENAEILLTNLVNNHTYKTSAARELHAQLQRKIPNLMR